MNLSFNPKLGIDNPAFFIEEDPGLHSELTVRTCVLQKDASGNFGFNLRMEVERDGHIVHQVVPMSPAYLAGLKEGDQLLQVNGEYVHEQQHLRVVQKVKASGSRVSLTVLDETTYRRLYAKSVAPLSILNKSLPQSFPRPRLCLVCNTGSGFGFTASATGGICGTFILTVEDGGAAQKAGVPHGSCLLEVNGESIRNFTLSQLTNKLQNSGSRVILLLLESSAWPVYTFYDITPSIAFADPLLLPYKMRKLRMIRGSQGYGFLLRQEKHKGRRGQFLREIVPGLPAEVSGMREGDHLLGVNGQSVEDLEHEDIVNLINKSGNQVTLLVISNEGNRFYNEIGVSPLLFYEDETPDILK